MIGRIVNGILGVGLGVVVVIYARKIVEFTGVSATLERYLGDGGTYMGVRVLGLIITVFSFLNAFGLLDAAITGIGQSLFGN